MRFGRVQRLIKEVKEARTIAEEQPAAQAQSFEAFFEREHHRLFGTLCLVTGSAIEAEDLMQEAFLKLWERWEQVGAVRDPVAYLYRTAFNAFRSRRRRLLRAVRVPAAQSPDPLAAVETRHSVMGALRKLSPRQRTALVLTDLLAMTSDEAAVALGIRPGTVRMLASQGRAAMRKVLEGQNG